MDSTDSIGPGNKRLSLRRSIVGSIKRSLSPLSKKSNSPTTSQTSVGSVDSTKDNLFSNKGQIPSADFPSKSSKYKTSNSLSPNSHVVSDSVEEPSSQKDQYLSNHISKTSRIPKSTSFTSSNRVSVQSLQDIPSPKKKLPTRAASTTSKLRKSLSASFFRENKHSIQAVKNLPAQGDHRLLPFERTSSTGTRLPNESYPASITTNNRSSIQSVQELPSPDKNVSLPAQALSTSGRYSTEVRLPAIMNYTTPKSEQSTPTTTKRSSIASFQIPGDAQVDSLQNGGLLNIQPPSNASRSNRSSWLSMSRTSSTKSGKQSQPSRTQHLGLGTGRETLRCQRRYVSTTAKETTLPWDPPFDRNWDLMANDGVPSDLNNLFEHSLPSRPNSTYSPLFNLPIKVRRKIYSFCLPDSRNITVCLSPHFAIKNCYHGYYFTSPWDVLETVVGGLGSFNLLRNDLMTYFWTEYQFHVTLTPFCNSTFTPLSSVWLPNFLDRIQHLTIEIDLTRFGGNALKFARRFGYNMEKIERLLLAIVDGLMDRSGRMSELTLLCRRFDGNRPVDENDSDWKSNESFEYFPREAMQFCDAIINLRGTVKSVRIAGFPLEYTKTLLKSMFGQGEVFRPYHTPDRSAWPPLPPFYAGIIRTPNLYAASMAPMSPEFPNHRESLNTHLICEESDYPLRLTEGHLDSPMRPGTSPSITTIDDHVLYQNPLTTSPNSSHESAEPLSDTTETLISNATVTNQAIAAEDRNNLKLYTKKVNPRNSGDFSPGHFYCQPNDDTEHDLVSQEGQKPFEYDIHNSIQPAANNTRASQVSSHAGNHSFETNTRQRIYTVQDKALPKMPNHSSKRKSHVGERQMPDIPESPVAIRSGTLKASNNFHLNRIRTHIEKATSECDGSSNKPSSLPTVSQTSIVETFEDPNNRVLVRSLSREFNLETSKDCNDSSPSPISQQSSKHDTKQLLAGSSIDRSCLRTPSPSTGPVTATSPNTLNSMNEQDPKYILSIRALRSASTSTESVIRVPPNVHRPLSLAYPTTWSGMNISPMAAPLRNFTSTGSQTQRSESSESGPKRLRLPSWFRRSN